MKELFDGCCPVLNSNPPQYKQFNLRTHLCCDVPIERDSNTKCCYLRNANGTFTPKSYDYTTNCCAYPFKSITPKSGNTCVADATAAPSPVDITPTPGPNQISEGPTSATEPSVNTKATTPPKDDDNNNDDDNN